MTAVDPDQMSADHLNSASEHVRWAIHTHAQASRYPDELSARVATAEELARRLSDYIDRLRRTYADLDDTAAADGATLALDDLGPPHPTSLVTSVIGDGLQDAAVNLRSVASNLSGVHVNASRLKFDR